jgi:transcriptional regulator with XRE-family HTH domain
MVDGMDDFAEGLRAAMAARGFGVRALARRVHCDPGLISRLASGKQDPSPKIAALLGEALGVPALATARTAPAPPVAVDEATEAIDIARRATASDIGEPTVERLEQAADDMALAYPRTPPGELLRRTRGHLDYAAGLLGSRMTLGEHRRLLVTMGWLSLVAATCLIDLRRFPAASAHLHTAAQLARETGQPEIAAWCLETKAWQEITAGNYQRAADLSQAAQRVAPRGGSAYIQASGQEARAFARLGAPRETRDALARTEALAAPLTQPDRPEHHYHYDPAKFEAYAATTLAWLGDPAAAGYARDVVAHFEDRPTRRPRRAALARLDLALALTASGEFDEAAATALEAVLSGLLVPSNYWRAAEVIAAVDKRDVAASKQLNEAYAEFCPSSRALPPKRG